MNARPAFLVVSALTAALVTGACASRKYVYQPAVNTSAMVEGRPASYYAIPPEAPRGDVRLATFGLVDITPQDEDDDMRGVHIRMIVANNADVPWSVDTREQRLALPNDGESRPAYATVDVGQPPVIEIPPGQKRTIDLFFPLPAHMQKEKELPSFDTLWRVQTSGGGFVAERTPFERLDVTPVYDRSYYGAGYYGAWGPTYWYDPWYPRGAFHGVYVSPRYIDRPVIIQPAPTAPPATRVR